MADLSPGEQIMIDTYDACGTCPDCVYQRPLIMQLKAKAER